MMRGRDLAIPEEQAIKYRSEAIVKSPSNQKTRLWNRTLAKTHYCLIYGYVLWYKLPLRHNIQAYSLR